METKLDCFHGINRITKTLKLAKHGAGHHYSRRLSDCFFVVDKRDLDKVRAVLKAAFPQKSENEITRYLFANWKFVLRNCRRAIPPPEVLLARFDRVNSLSADIRDSRTGEPLFRICNASFPSSEKGREW
jgi:hypothetical protein